MIQNLAAALVEKVQRIREAKHLEIEEALFHWVIEAHAHSVSIDGQVLQ